MMQVSRRQAAAGLLGSLGAMVPLSFALAQVPPAELENPPTPDEPNTQLDTGRDRYEHMMAPVTINGQGPFQFLIDTGANVSCISHDLADRLALMALPPARVHTVVGVRERPNVLIDELRVGARNRRQVSAPAMPFNGGLDGVLGVDWLKGQRLVLGFKDKNLEITRSKDDVSIDGSVVVPARRRLGQLTIVDADMSGRRINAMIDSGSQTTICNSALRDVVAAAERRKGIREQVQRVNMETLIGEPFAGEMLYLPFVRLGGLQLGNVPVVHADMHVFDLWGLKRVPALVLGMDLLTQFDTVTLDFGRSQVRFDLSEALRQLPSAKI